MGIEAPRGSVKFVKIENTGGNTYEVYTASSRKEALTFLRDREVKEEGRYLIVETPEGNIGRDLIMIFDEKSQETIEFPSRKPLAALVRSLEKCTGCGYTVIPAGAVVPGATYSGYVDPLKEKGGGYVCAGCKTLWCTCCAPFESDWAVCGICRQRLQLFVEGGEDQLATELSAPKEPLQKCGGCGAASDLQIVADKRQNHGFLCPPCSSTYQRLLEPDSIKSFWGCGACGFRILAGTTVDGEVDRNGSRCPHCGADVNSTLVNLSHDAPIGTGIMGEPIE